MAYPVNVNITVEALPENTIKEITYDGQEIYQPPLSLSENLSYLIRKIDFSSNPDDAESSESQDATQMAVEPSSNSSNNNSSSSSSSSSNTIPSVWITASNKIRETITEVGVLLDVLRITREKRYMVLDPVPQEPFEVKPLAQVYSRKKGLFQAATMLISSAERIRTFQSESRNASVPDFYTELLRLRQNWRLKKVSNTIIGDLSYRTAGSRFQQTGMFEVTKAEEHNSDDAAAAGDFGGGTSSPSQTNKPLSALNVTIPTELQGVAYIMVKCQKDNRDIFNTPVNLLPSASNASSSANIHWQQKLEAAQNILFCKELFSLLAREAVQLQAPIPHLVFGNQIIATVLPNVQLVIALCHSSNSNDKKCDTNSTAATTTTTNNNNISIRSSSSNYTQSKSNHDHVLEHSLHQLLREAHYKNTHHPFVHPANGNHNNSSAAGGPSMLAGAESSSSSSKKSSGTLVVRPIAADRHDLIEMAKTTTMLEKIIEQTQYYFMRLKAEEVLDAIAKEQTDPMIISHWNTINSPSPSCVRITILSQGFDAIHRTSLLLQILKNGFKCVCKDGKVVTLSYESEELKNFVLYQMQNHQIIGVQNIAKSMGWQLLTSSPQLGVGPMQPYTWSSSTILVSSAGDRLIAIKCEPQGKVQVNVACLPRKDFFSGQLIKERKWENLDGSFQEVQLKNMEGKNFLNKMELLMASLTSSS